MKARLLLLTLLTAIGIVCPAQSNLGGGTIADAVIIIRRDTTIVLRCDTVVRQVYDTLTADQLDNLVLKRNASKKFVASQSTVNAIYRTGISDSLSPLAHDSFGVNLPAPDSVATTKAVSPSQAVAKADEDGLPETIIDKKGRRISRTERDIQKLVFVPKGTWFGGATVSYSEQDFDNLNYLLIKDINAKGYTFGISPFFGYFVKKNLAFGARFTYNRTLMDIGNLDLNLGEDFNIGLKDMYYLEHDYQAAGFMRTYMPLGRSKIFGFFSEARLTYGHSQAKILNGRYEEGTLDGTYSESNYMHIGFAPGLTAFVQDWMSVEVQLGVMGFNFKWTEQVTNQVERGRQRNFSGMFDIDLFSIQIGTTIYL